MFDINSYIIKLIDMLRETFNSRLLYVGLQGSYLRGEANENSDIDIMVIINDISVADLNDYRKIIASLEMFDKSCGFICGKDEMLKWNPLEICHLLHTTKDYYGVLADFVPEYSENDIRNYVNLSVNNLFHEICHRYIHANHERNIAALPQSYKAVFFILQNLHYLRTGEFINNKERLINRLTGRDRAVLETAVKLSKGEEYDFVSAFALLFDWCKDIINSIDDTYK